MCVRLINRAVTIDGSFCSGKISGQINVFRMLLFQNEQDKRGIQRDLLHQMNGWRFGYEQRKESFKSKSEP
jgi:hypothetical protein